MIDEHIKYPKIHRLGKDEVKGILDGEVMVQEKIDGSNTSIWFNVNGELCFGSRNNKVPDFRGIKTYVEKHKGVIELLEQNPHYRLFGEWLCKHTISYNQLSYNHFYLFDILDESANLYLCPMEVAKIADKYGIKRPTIYLDYGCYSEEQIKEHVGKSELGPQGEGVVIKNHSYRNRFGDRYYAKIVTESFKENNAITFGGNNKHSDSYWEVYCMNEFITIGRVKKIIQKIESLENRKLDLKDTPRVSSTVYHDMIEEEAWTMNKKNMKIDFKKLQNVCSKKIVQIYKEILEDDISVGHKE